MLIPFGDDGKTHMRLTAAYEAHLFSLRSRLYPSCRSGISLVELAFVLLIVSIMLGGIWVWAASLRDNLSVSDASRQVRVVVDALRKMHPSDRIKEDENIANLDLPLAPQLKPVIKGRMFLRSPWIGPILLYPGHAVGWGGDEFTSHMTLSYERVPQDNCVDFVQSVYSAMRLAGLMAIYISPAIGKGDLTCLGTDLYCKTAESELPIENIKQSCAKNYLMTVMFTFNQRGE